MNNKLKIVTTLIVSALILTGCKTREQRIQSAQLSCSDFGFKYGSPEFASCVQQTYTADTERQNQAFQNLGRQMQQMSQPPSTINCTSSRMGAFVNTRCY